MTDDTNAPGSTEERPQHPTGTSAASHAQTPAVADRHEGIRVLHVDDDPEFLSLAGQLLAREDPRIEVTTATGAEAGLEALADGDVDCVVSDYEMPGLDGIEFLEAVREHHPNLPFILFTGHGSEAIASRAISAGVTSYLRKRAGIDQYTVLAHRIVDAVEKHRITREHQRLSGLFQSIPQPVVHVRFEDLEPIVLDVNRAFETVFGFDRETLRGESLDDFVVPEGAEPGATDINRASARGEIVEREVRRRTDDGVQTFVFRVMRTDTGHGVPEAVGMYVDITERTAYERELEQQRDRLDEFAGIVSHDLRNPLNVAEGRLDLAQSALDEPDVPAAAEQLDAVSDSLGRMRTLIEDLLALARVNEAVTDLEPLELATMVSRCWENVQTGPAELAVRAEGTVVADTNRLAQLIENLLRNAIEHAGPAVTITVGDLDDGFYVADDGPGIPEAERESVFESGYTSTPDGTGFGLSIVRTVADAHDWTVAVAESADGGARFEVRGVERPD